MLSEITTASSASVVVSWHFDGHLNSGGVGERWLGRKNGKCGRAAET